VSNPYATSRWMWARLDNRWDIYAQNEQLFRVRVESTGIGGISRIYDERGFELRMGVVLVREISEVQS
jgi:hypothetical protein